MPASCCEIEYRNRSSGRGHRDQDARDARPTLQDQNQNEGADADHKCHEVRASRNHFSTIPTACRSGPSAETEKPKSFGIWLSTTVSAMPFM